MIGLEELQFRLKACKIENHNLPNVCTIVRMIYDPSPDHKGIFVQFIRANRWIQQSPDAAQRILFTLEIISNSTRRDEKKSTPRISHTPAPQRLGNRSKYVIGYPLKNFLHILQGQGFGWFRFQLLFFFIHPFAAAVRQHFYKFIFQNSNLVEF